MAVKEVIICDRCGRQLEPEEESTAVRVSRLADSFSVELCSRCSYLVVDLLKDRRLQLVESR